MGNKKTRRKTRKRRRLKLSKGSLEIRSPLAANDFKPLRLRNLAEYRKRTKYMKDAHRLISEQLSQANKLTKRSN